MNLNPKLWGPAFWKSLYAVALGYPNSPTVDQQYHYKRWFYHLQFVLPCEKCRQDNAINQQKIPIDLYLKSRESLLHWINLIENQGRLRLNQTPITLSESLQKHLNLTLTEGFPFSFQFGSSRRIGIVSIAILVTLSLLVVSLSH